jgi:hypothetical protein
MLQDRVLVPLKEEKEGGEEDDPYLVVHPNYFMES